MILITGATGNVGGHLLEQLCERSVPVRALVRSQERADTLRGYDCDIAVGTYEDAASLHRALAGVDRLFLLSPASEHMADQEKAVVDAAAAAHGQVEVVKVAAAGVEQGGIALLEQHRTVIDHLAASGLPTTVLAPSSFMQNLLGYAGQITETGTFAAAGGGAAISHVDTRDVAAVAAHVLTSDGHAGATYTITGPEALTYARVAEHFTVALGRPVRHVEISSQQARESMAGAGMPVWLADALAELSELQSTGAAAGTTDEVLKATGRPARSFEAFLTDHGAAFRSV